MQPLSTDPSLGDAPLALWSRISRLSHPNLLALLDFGRAENAGDAFLYAAFEFPDDTLAAALGRAPLSETESREVHQAISETLRYVHSQGLVHTAVDGGHIVAVGNQIKLASDTLRLFANRSSQVVTSSWRLLDHTVGRSAVAWRSCAIRLRSSMRSLATSLLSWRTPPKLI